MSPAINGIKVPQNLLGNLIETNLLESKDTDLQNALQTDGYIYIKNVINEDEISASDLVEYHKKYHEDKK